MRRAAFLLLCFPIWLLAQMVPDAPIRDFRLPRFGDDGYKSWELRGISGTYLNSNEVKVEGLDLITYRGAPDLEIDTRIRSPRAHIHLEDNSAKGESALFVSGPSFSIEGRNWSWSHNEQKIVVREAVRVRINDQINILK